MNVTLMSGYIATEPTFNTFPKKKKRRGDTRKKGMAANFRISVKRGYMGKDGQKYDYFSCSAYDDSAKYIRRYIQEGDYVLIRAVLKNNNYYYIQNELNSSGYKMILCISDSDFNKEKEYIELATSQKAAGIISISYSQMNDFVRPGMPLVSYKLAARIPF